MQLLKITTIPIQYTIEMEPSRLEVKPADSPEVQLRTKSGEMQMRHQDIKVRIDSSRARHSLGFRTSSEFASEAAANGKQAGKAATAQYAQMGNRMAYNKSGTNTISQAVTQKLQAGAAMKTQQTFLPNVGAEISWQPGELTTRYQPAELQTDWQIHRNELNYVPGKFKMNISQYPKVQIEYIGEPNYVPPSSNPNYKEEE